MICRSIKKHCISVKILCLVTLCLLFMRIPQSNARYLPTRRSEPSDYGLDRLSDLLKNVSFKKFLLILLNKLWSFEVTWSYMKLIKPVYLVLDHR